MRARPVAVLTLSCTAQFLDVLGVTVVVVALPEIQRGLGLAPAMLPWVAGLYALLFGGFLVLGGRAADLLGLRATFAAGTALVTGGAVLAGAATSAPLLLAGRATAGLGAAFAVPAALAAVLAAFPDGPPRGRALGVWTAAGAAGGATGFVLGGVVTALAGWRWLFLGLALLGLPAALAGHRVLPAARARGSDELSPGERPPGRRSAGERLARERPGGGWAGGSTAGSRPAADADAGPAARSGAGRRLDLPGAVLVTAAVLLVVLGCTRTEARGVRDAQVWGPLLLAAAAAAGFAAVERRAADPLVPPFLWRSRPLALAAAVAAVLTATTSGAAVLATLYLQQSRGVSAAASGLLLLAFSLAVLPGSALGPVLARHPARGMAAGLAGIAAAALLAAVAVVRGGVVSMAFALALGGAALGAASVTSTASGTAAVRPEYTGLAGGVLNAAAQVGTAVGTALLLVASAAGPGVRSDVVERAGLVRGYLLAATLAAVAAAAALSVKGARRPPAAATGHALPARTAGSGT